MRFFPTEDANDREPRWSRVDFTSIYGLLYKELGLDYQRTSVDASQSEEPSLVYLMNRGYNSLFDCILYIALADSCGSIVISSPTEDANDWEPRWLRVDLISIPRLFYKKLGLNDQRASVDVSESEEPSLVSWMTPSSTTYIELSFMYTWLMTTEVYHQSTTEDANDREQRLAHVDWMCIDRSNCRSAPASVIG